MFTLLHEIGHSLGLTHPFVSTVLPAAEDNDRYTVMTYTEVYGSSGVYAAGPMLYDIAAIQHLYGANTNFNSGNTTYSFGDSQIIYETLWDGGGIDSIVYTGARTATINLNPGTFSSIGLSPAGDGTTAVDNLSIAFGATIENAVGGSGNDVITGNSADNTLTGGGGSDLLVGGGGADALDGGIGNDTLNGGAGADTLTGGGGNDSYVVDSSGDQVVEASGGGTDWVNSSVTFTLAANVENLTLTGSASIDGIGNALANVITGNAGSNSLIGGAGADALDGGTGGNDRLEGGSGYDSYFFDGNWENDDLIDSSTTGRIDFGTGNLNDLTAVRSGDDLVIQGPASNLNFADFYGGNQIAGWTFAYDNGAASFALRDILQNLPSSVTGNSVTVGVGQSVSAGTAFSVSDPEGDAMVTYAFKDWGVGSTTAYVSVNGVRQPDGSWIEVSAADLAQTTIVGGSEPGSESIYVWAHDGTRWGSAGKLSVTTVASPEFAIDDVRVDETAGSATFTVTRGGDSSAAASVDYATADGTATAASDYLSASGTLTFGAGVTQRTVTVGVSDDTSDEPDEVFYLDLSNASGAAIGDSRGAATIVDDDVNLPSSVTGNSVTVGVGQSVSAGTAFSVSDPEGDAMVTYAFKDWGVGSTTAYVSVNGVRQPDGSWIEVSAADLAQTTIVGGSEPGSESIYVWAHDGTRWGSAGKLSVTTVAPPEGALGNDTLSGGAGNDRLIGGAGDDVFVLHDGGGNDTITDFVAGGTEDSLDVSDFGFASFAAVQTRASQAGADTLIALDDDDSVTLLGVNLGDLSQDDFLI